MLPLFQMSSLALEIPLTLVVAIRERETWYNQGSNWGCFWLPLVLMVPVTQCEVASEISSRKSCRYEMIQRQST